MQSFRNLDDFLRTYKTTDKEGLTHTNIGDVPNGVFPGSYIIPEDQLQMFHKLYHRAVFVNKKSAYLTEVQLHNGKGRILIDIDMRYEPCIQTRQHSTDYLFDITDLYMDKIAKMCKFTGGEIVGVFIFEKAHPNTTNEKITKDGIHLVIDIQMDHIKQQILRKLVLNDIHNILESLPLTNSYDEVLDEGISKGHTNWQLYGSRKPGNEAYQAVKYLKYTYNADDSGFEFEQINLSDINDLQILSLVSARNPAGIESLLREEYKEQYDNLKTSNSKIRPHKRNFKNKFTKHGISTTIDEIECSMQISECIDQIFAELNPDEYKMKETHKFVMCLPAKYYDNHNEWLRVGWALHNCDFRLFLSWMLFSSQSVKFNCGDIQQYLDQWMSFQDEGYTGASIRYWAQEENPNEYKRIKAETVNHYIMQSISGTDGAPDMEWEIANVVYHVYKNRYRCASVKTKTWYKFEKHRWVKNEEGCGIRQGLSKDIARSYCELTQDYMNLVTHDTTLDLEVQQKYKKTAGKLSRIAEKLKNSHFKTNVMKECAAVFFDEDGEFLKHLDEKRFLLGFQNGVYDFNEGYFRPGRADDYISLSTKIDYQPIDDANPEHQVIMAEINDFMEKLFPQPDLRKYMWNHLGATLIGGNKPQTFNIYIGCGRNGKSKLVELMSLVLGDYKGVVPISYVTQKRTGVGAVSPEIALLKGVRYAVMQEPKKGEKLNDGVMKELTGEDWINARALYVGPITFRPQFFLVVATNSLFDINTTDDGTWRRIRKADFVSKFEDNPQPTEKNPYIYLKDPDIEQKFETWKPVFMAMLIEIAMKNKGIVPDCDIVLSSSNAYRHDQDYLSEFFEQKIKQGNPDQRIKRTELHEVFKKWYEENYSKRTPPGKDLYGYLNKRIGKYKLGKGWYGYQIIYEHDEDFDDEI